MTIKERKKLLKDAISIAKVIRDLHNKIDDPKVKVGISEGCKLVKYLEKAQELLRIQTSILEITSTKEDNHKYDESNGVWRYAWGEADEYVPVNVTKEDEEGCCCEGSMPIECGGNVETGGN